MKKNLTEIVFILDCSGSMNGLEGDTIGGAIHHIGNVTNMLGRRTCRSTPYS